jgi:hypothetical protein
LWRWVRPDTGFDIHNLIESVLILATMGVSRYCLWLFVCLFVCLFGCLFVCLMVTNATFNNITVISWQSVLLVEETGCLRETQQSAASHWQTLSHNVVHLALMVIRTRWSVVVGTDCLGSCKSNYHTITATTVPYCLRYPWSHRIYFDFSNNTVVTIPLYVWYCGVLT